MAADFIDPDSAEPTVVPRSARAGGRKRDETRDAAILDATIDILVEVGFEKMTVDMVAARARAGKGAVYRRWPSKTGMVLDAITRMKLDQANPDHLSDTGSLRGDMLALFDAGSASRGERFMQAVAALAALLAQQPGVADAGHDALVEPWVQANRILIGRAVERGEARADADVEALAQIVPSMGGYRSLIQRRPFDRGFLVGLLDQVLLPALGIKPPPTP
jgi:AcrR family transcriptional regulator